MPCFRLGLDELRGSSLQETFTIAGVAHLVGDFYLARAGAAAAAALGAAGLHADVAALDLGVDERGDEEDAHAAAAQEREGEAAQPGGEVSRQRLERREEDRLEPVG